MRKSIQVVIAGVVLFIGGLVLGLGGVLVGTMQSFDRMADSTAPPVPGQLAEGLSLALVATAIGIPISLIGLCLVVGGLVAWFLGRR
jgi:biopolymer transport protein ExbB/TolQ